MGHYSSEMGRNLSGGVAEPKLKPRPIERRRRDG